MTVGLTSAQVPYSSLLSPLLYTWYTADLPKHPRTLLAPYIDEKAILTIHSDPHTASHLLQEHLSTLQVWFRHWIIKINAQKNVSSHIHPLAKLNSVLLSTSIIPSSHQPTLFVTSKYNWIKSKHGTLKYVLNAQK